MSLFLETIKINNGRRFLLDEHNRRMNYTRNRHFHEIRDIDLREIVVVPAKYSRGLVKCRVTYGRKVEKVEYEDYIFRDPRTFKIIAAEHIEYEYKYADRTDLDALFTQKGVADDLLMIRDGLLTDSYYANIALLKDQCWYTPARPLLRGTYRSYLLANEKLVERDIPVDEIMNFEKLKIYNAMVGWTGHRSVDINEVSVIG